MTHDTNTTICYITTPDKVVATELARGMVERRLAACAQIIAGATSIYMWEGEMQEEGEHIIIAKTREERACELEEYVKSAHPYECPAIIFLPARAEGNFARWVKDQTRYA